MENGLAGYLRGLNIVRAAGVADHDNPSTMGALAKLEVLQAIV